MKAHTKIGNALIEMRQLIDERYVGYETDPGAAEPPLPEVVQHWVEVLTRWHAGYHEYVALAAARVGSRLPPTRTGSTRRSRMTQTVGEQSFSPRSDGHLRTGTAGIGSSDRVLACSHIQVDLTAIGKLVWSWWKCRSCGRELVRWRDIEDGLHARCGRAKPAMTKPTGCAERGARPTEIDTDATSKTHRRRSSGYARHRPSSSHHARAHLGAGGRRRFASVTGLRRVPYAVSVRSNAVWRRGSCQAVSTTASTRTCEVGPAMVRVPIWLA